MDNSGSRVCPGGGGGRTWLADFGATGLGFDVVVRVSSGLVFYACFLFCLWGDEELILFRVNGQQGGKEERKKCENNKRARKTWRLWAGGAAGMMVLKDAFI